MKKLIALLVALTLVLITAMPANAHHDELLPFFGGFVGDENKCSVSYSNGKYSLDGPVIVGDWEKDRAALELLSWYFYDYKTDCVWDIKDRNFEPWVFKQNIVNKLSFFGGPINGPTDEAKHIHQNILIVVGGKAVVSEEKYLMLHGRTIWGSHDRLAGADRVDTLQEVINYIKAN